MATPVSPSIFFTSIFYLLSSMLQGRRIRRRWTAGDVQTTVDYQRKVISVQARRQHQIDFMILPEMLRAYHATVGTFRHMYV
jgi:hypothetical protein